MKLIKLASLFILCTGLIFTFSLCDNDDDGTDSTTDPTPNVCDTASSACSHSGTFCEMMDTAFDNCLFEGSSINLTEEQTGDFTCSLNTVWSTLSDAISNRFFDEATVNSEIDSFISANSDAINILIQNYLAKLSVCEENTAGTKIVDSLIELIEVINQLAYSTTGDYWEPVYSYSRVIGLTDNQAQSIINSTMQSVNESFYLINHDGSVGSEITGGILGAVSGDPCAFDTGSVNSSAPANLVSLLDLIINENGDAQTIISGLLSSEIPAFIDNATSLISSIHSQSSDPELLSDTVSMLSGMLSDIITSENLNNCPE